MDDKLETNIEPHIVLYIDRRAGKEANRARWEAIFVVGLFATALSVAATLGVLGLIGQIVHSQLEERSYQQIQEQAKEGHDLIFDQLEAARGYIGTNVGRMDEHLEAAAQARADWEDQPEIEVGVYNLDVPYKFGTWRYNTGVSTKEFAAASISGFHMYRDNDKECLYSDNVKIQTVRSEKAWYIRVHKEEGCNRVFVSVVYFPNGWVGKIHDRNTLVPEE